MQQADPKLVAKAAEFMRSRERSKAELVRELTLLQERVLMLEASQGSPPNIFAAQNRDDGRSLQDVEESEAKLQQTIQEFEARNRELEQARRELEEQLESAQAASGQTDAQEENHSGDMEEWRRRSDDLKQENLGIKRELVDLQVANEELSESNRRLRKLVDSCPALIWSFSPDRQSAEFNQAFFDFVGEDQEDRQSSWQAHLHPDDLEGFNETVRRSIESGGPFALEHRLLRGDGSCRWFWTVGAPCLDEDSPALGEGGLRYAGASLDITTQRETEQSVADDERRRKNLLRECWASRERELRELHQGLKGFASPLAAASEQLEALTEQIEELKELWRAAEEARTELSARPSPAALQEEGLERAFAELAQLFGQCKGADVDCVADGAIPRLSPESELLIFNAVRDLLDCLSKAAETGALRMILGSEQDHLRILVQGQGFYLNGADAGENGSESNLSAVCAQLKLLDGQLDVQEAQEESVQVELSIPAAF